METNEITAAILKCAFKIHTKLGPGLLESVYQECLAYELEHSGFRIEKELAIPLVYDQVKLDCGYRLDLLIEDKVIVEIKAVESFNEVHLAQILTYLKLTELKTGLLLNFNVVRMKDGIRRVVKGFSENE